MPRWEAEVTYGALESDFYEGQVSIFSAPVIRPRSIPKGPESNVKQAKALVASRPLRLGLSVSLNARRPLMPLHRRILRRNRVSSTGC